LTVEIYHFAGAGVYPLVLMRIPKNFGEFASCTLLPFLPTIMSAPYLENRSVTGPANTKSYIFEVWVLVYIGTNFTCIFGILTRPVGEMTNC
jgi:hypothetical protein